MTGPDERAKRGERRSGDDILGRLESLYPEAGTELTFRNPFELLIAAILSAQTTDRKVNEVTRALFDECSKPEDFLELSQEELEGRIRTIGLYRNKARSILGTCRRLVEEHGGEVPRDRAALEALPGVGRKVAGVVLANAFDTPAIAVDTHVFRVANRLGLADAPDPLKTEIQLMDCLPEAKWSRAHHCLIQHGRRVCRARNPRCADCALADRCRHHATASETGP